jgi:hypothetical protein
MEGEIIIGGVGLGVIITFLVQLAKKAGLPDGYAGWLSLGLSVAGYALFLLTKQLPDILPTVTSVLSVLAYIATTFGSALVAYKGLRKAEVLKT